jgi:hypothetical protein
MLLNLDQMRYFAFAPLAFALTCATIGDRPALAQLDAIKASSQKWRPKNGIYETPDKDFAKQCKETTSFTVELDEKRISGNEWGCEITKLTDMGVSAIKLNMTCDNYNLAGNLKLPESTRFKETMLLRKIDESTIFVRQTTNGKFRDAGWRLAYCPEDAQRTDREARERDRAKAERSPASSSEGAPVQWPSVAPAK